MAKKQCHCETSGHGCPLKGHARAVCVFLHETQDQLAELAKTNEPAVIAEFEKIGDVCAVYGLRIQTRVHGAIETLKVAAKIVNDVIVEDHKEGEALAELFVHTLKVAAARQVDRAARQPIAPGEKVH